MLALVRNRPAWPISRLAVVALRIAGVLSLVFVILHWRPVDIALFALVLLGLVLSWLARTPFALDAVFAGSMLTAAWSSAAGWYSRIEWLDVPVHAVANGALAAVAYWALHQRSLKAEERRPPAPRTVFGWTIGLGSIFAVVWEAAEFAGYRYVDAAINVAAADTAGDLAAAVVGSITAGAILACWVPSRPGG